jgi:hypothetical protein
MRLVSFQDTEGTEEQKKLKAQMNADERRWGIFGARAARDKPICVHPFLSAFICVPFFLLCVLCVLCGESSFARLPTRDPAH